MEKLYSNYHTHTFRCGHALPNPDEDYVLKAIELGYKNLGFSDHAPFKCIQHPSMRMDFDNGFFDYLKSINTDIIGWIEIEDTNINYPILKGSIFV